MVENMFMKKCTKKNAGSYIVEAAIFVPIFVLSLLTIGYAVKIVGIYENVNHGASDELSFVAAKAYENRNSSGIKSRLEKRISEENPSISKLKVKNLKYLYSNGETDDLISAEIKYYIGINLPLNLYSGVDRKIRWLTRGFTGIKTKNKNMPFEEMENNGDGGIVWIFPETRTKYHTKSCSYVTANPSEVILTEAIRAKYNTCRICGSGDIKTGRLVYCFFRYGGAYHRSDCSTVKKYTMRISRKEAEEKGYRPCSKCGGGIKNN